MTAIDHRPLIRQCALSSATHAQVADREDAVAIAAQFRAWLTYPGGETVYSRLWTVCAEAYEARAAEAPEAAEPCQACDGDAGHFDYLGDWQRCSWCGGTGIEP